MTDGVAGPCRPTDFCWQSPLPTGNHLRAVSMLSSTSGFAVGELGGLWQLSAAGWSAFRTTFKDTLLGVAAISDNQAVAVGQNGLVLRFDGNQWSKTSCNTA